MVEINQFKESEFSHMMDLSKQARHELSEFIRKTHDLENALQHVINLSKERVNAAESVYKLTNNKFYDEVKKWSQKEIKELEKELERLKDIFAEITDVFQIEDEVETHLTNIADSK